MNGVHIQSCYAPSYAALEEPEQMLNAVVLDTRRRWPIIKMGDVRGRVLLEALAKLDVVLPDFTTFRGWDLAFIVDLTCVVYSARPCDIPE